MDDIETQDCQKIYLAIQDTISVIGGKWKLILLTELLTKGDRQFRQLSRDVGITSRMLSKELDDLEANKLVRRTPLDTRPLTVEYSATAYSKTLKDVVLAMSSWGKRHREVIAGRDPDVENAP
ncbi:helix-turn-helix transcriptional regulator [Mucilaginibacter sp. UR6-1]|uniref:winged helix-turn-helix transcriptional regulator n=1 Tax=Mucilaginibacter sp. UR6-1 TaxID=1435643 RepID=UPI001E318507|nr:helix-turn-helix domain-containing protein [Mucilaginibacter sp. UR6-1]MCC8407755.1 helix-turn-helix transcriptional regulator [Mucilaginibacter sp. UR6-1]